MRCASLALLLAGVLVALQPAHAAERDGRLYARVTTRDGRVFEGFLRWDKNEVSWLDVLDGSKTVPGTAGEAPGTPRGRRENRASSNGDERPEVKVSGIRFGHLERLEPRGRDRALLVLRSGQEVDLHDGETDLGTDIREIIVEDARRGTVTLDWVDIERVEFGAAPARATSRLGERLFGTVTTRQGEAFTGFLCWDVDEVLSVDSLDGEDEHRREHHIPFGTITGIARQRGNGVLVTLRNREEIGLYGTNDVNSENRGILILDPALGQIRVSWDDFDHLAFARPRRTVRYNGFPGQGPLRGTVTTRSGEKITGAIRWDDDEAYAWEFLDGKQAGVSFFVEFGFVERIARSSASSARVTLRDGRAFELRDANDVNDQNSGIYVTRRNGEEVRLDWEDFDVVVFQKP
jgi:hypothetical protein